MSVDLSLIVAMSVPMRVIGRKNTLPWQLPSDLSRFKHITTETKNIVMGYTTYASILTRNKRPLPNRHHIVLTRDHLDSHEESVEFVSSVEKVCAVLAGRGSRGCIIGGEQIYSLFLHLVRVVYITEVHAALSGDAYFPKMPSRLWNRVYETGVKRWDARDEYPSSFVIYEQTPP